MTKTVWIVGAIVVVGVGIGVGILFAGGNDAPAIAASAATGTGTVASAATTAVASTNPVMAIQTDVQAHVESDTDVRPIVIETLDDLFANAASYSSKAVVVRGTIVTQCISGCTFSLEDGTAVIAVELVDDALDHVLDGGSVGRRVEVRGTVETSPQLVIVLEDPDDWNYLN